MLLLCFFLLCTGLTAWRLTTLLAIREPEPVTGLERGVWLGTVGLAIWLVEGYVLAFAGRFTAGALLALSLLVLLAVLTATRRQPLGGSWRPLLTGLERRQLLERVGRHRYSPATLLPAILVGLWVAYTVGALWVLPVSNHDALSYHFPKAAWLTTTGAFGLYPSQDLRVTYFPGNYEVLVATFLTFVRSDRGTGLITSGSLLLFLFAALVLFRRVWGRSSAAALALPVMLASPVLLLHTTAHKNDILMAAVTLNALIWLGRYAVRGGPGSAVIGGVSVALAVGTKFHGLFLVLASTVLVWNAWRNGVWRPTPIAATLQAVGAGVGFLLLGGAQYVANLASTGNLTGILQIATPNAMNTVAYPAYWQVPRLTWMLLAAPLFTRGQYFTVPWSGEQWFWPAYELYFSHYGVHVSVLILLLPLGVWWARRRLDALTRTELTGISIAGLVLVVLNMLMGLRPYGGFAFIPRFLFFSLPILLVWTWCPAVSYVSRARRLTWLPLAVSLALPIAYIGVTVHRDRFSPLEYVELLWRHPDWRRTIFHTDWRAASFVDRIAAPDAGVAIDSGYDGWTYPLWGERISRNVRPILNDEERYVPGPGIQWVAVDRAFPIVWGHPGFTDMSLASRYIDRGAVADHEVRVYRSLMKNPDFERVYFYADRFQAVFRRVRPVPAPMNPGVRPQPEIE